MLIEHCADRPYEGRRRNANPGPSPLYDPLVQKLIELCEFGREIGQVSLMHSTYVSQIDVQIAHESLDDVPAEPIFVS